MMSTPEPVEIHVYQGDSSKDICDQFCDFFDVKDKEKKITLQRVIDYQIEEHRNQNLNMANQIPITE